MSGRLEALRAGERAALIAYLDDSDPELLDEVRAAAEAATLQHCGAGVSLRGLIEFSNVCRCDCLYCGIRKSNRAVERYTLSPEEIVETARWCAQAGYASVVLQSGERRDRRFAAQLAETLRAIKAATRSAQLPEGLGITLCVGEQTREHYEAWFEAGAHRYLLRMESSSPQLFASLHPPAQRHAARLDCLRTLAAIGYQVGTGVMIGLPGQTLAMLADDILFFRRHAIDMIGMGPYIPHAQTPLAAAPVAAASTRLQLALRMISATRLVLPRVNIAATTALQTLSDDGRERGLRHGANVIMPQATPLHVRRNYLLYDNKPCLEDSAGQCAACLERRLHSVGRHGRLHQWGDSAHFHWRKQTEQDG